MVLIKEIGALLLAGFAVSVHAAADLDWLHQNLKNSEIVHRYTQGKVNGKTIIAVLAKADTPKEDQQPAIVIYENLRNGRKLIAEIVLVNNDAYRIYIKNDSIYIREDTVHHGIYFRHYQFKHIGSEFKLVGAETQSMTMSDYGVSEEERNQPGYKNVEMWSGTSTNFLASRTECWLQMFELPNSVDLPPAFKDAQSRFERGARPKKAIVGQFRFAPVQLLPLTKFDPYNVPWDSYPTCYFDYKKRLHRIPAREK